MFYIHKTELIRHHQNVLSHYFTSFTSLHDFTCLHFPCWILNNFYPSKITSLQESQSKNSWFFTTGNTTITESQQTARLHAGLPFPRVPALHTTYSSKSIQVNCSFQIYNIFPGSVPASEHHTSCKCSERTLVLWLSVLNAQKWDAIHSVIFHFFANLRLSPFLTFVSPIATSLPAEQLAELATERQTWFPSIPANS